MRYAWTLLLILSACSTTDHGVAYPCPHVRVWSDIDQINLKSEIDALPADSLLIPMAVDYARMRNDVRACAGNM